MRRIWNMDEREGIHFLVLNVQFKLPPPPIQIRSRLWCDVQGENILRIVYHWENIISYNDNKIYFCTFFTSFVSFQSIY